MSNRLTYGLLALAAGLLCGCATGARHPLAPVIKPAGNHHEGLFQRAQSTLTNQHLREYRAVHRAILTVGRKQFTCDGLLQVTTQDGWRLAVVSSLGLVAEARLTGAGATQLLKVTPLFRESWSRQYLARDLRWLFVPPSEAGPAGLLADGRPVLQTRPGPDGLQARYVFSPDGHRWEEMALARDGMQVYHVTLRDHRVVAGHVAPVPFEFVVQGETYQLELRTAELVPGPAARPATREVGP